MNEKAFRRPSLLPTTPASLVALVLTAMALFSIADWTTLRHYDGVDFWQFWGVTQARQVASGDPGSPYLHADAYQQALEQRAMISGDQALLNAIHFRKQPDLTGSPLLYAAFAVLPSEYRVSLTLYRCLQVLAFAVATALLLHAAGLVRTSLLAWLSAGLLAAYDPLMFDLMVGNVNALQLLAITAALLLCLRLRGSGNAREWLAAAVAGILLTGLALLKPNVGAALLALGLTLLARTTRSERFIVVAAGLATLLAAFLLTGMVFGSWTVWLDWWHKTFGSVARLSYPLDTGNQSTSLYLATRLDVATVDMMRALAALWFAALASALLWPLRRHTSALRAGARRLMALLQDPGCGLAIGIVTLYLLSPLSWPHYYVLGLLPAYWLLRDEKPSSLPALMAWLALLLMAGLARRFHAILGAPSDTVMFASRVFAWLPLSIGIIAKLAADATANRN